MLNALLLAASSVAVAEPNEIFVTDLQGWYRPDSMVISAGKLTSWGDKTGNSSMDLSPVSVDPDIVVGANAFNAVDLDTQSSSTGEHLETTASTLGLTSYYVAAVMRVDAYTGGRPFLYSDISGGTSTKMPIGSNPGEDRIIARTSDGALAEASWGSAVPAGTWMLVETYVESGVEIGLNIDDGTFVTTAMGATTSAGEFDGITLGGTGANNEPQDCSFTELVVVKRKFTAQERADLLSYFTARYGSIGTW